MKRVKNYPAEYLGGPPGHITRPDKPGMEDGDEALLRWEMDMADYAWMDEQYHGAPNGGYRWYQACAVWVGTVVAIGLAIAILGWAAKVAG
jgi:hypothetical protein